MGNCIVTFTINSNGTSKKFDLEVPEEFSQDIDNLSQYISKNKDDSNIQDFMAKIRSAISDTGYGIQEYHGMPKNTTEDKTKSKLNGNKVLCDRNLKSLLNGSKFDLNAFKGIGDANLLDKKYIIVTNGSRQFKFSTNVLRNQDGSKSYILPDDKIIINNFLRATYIIATHKTDQEFIDSITDILKNMEKKYSKICSKDTLVEDFILNYYLDADFKVSADRASQYEFQDKCKSYFPEHKFVDFKEYTWLSKIIKQGKISKDDFLKAYKKEYPTEQIKQEDVDRKFKEILNNINKDRDLNTFINIQYITSQYFHLDTSISGDPNLLRETESVNGEFLDLKFPIEEFYRGYFIYKYGDNYYCSKNLITSEEDFSDIKTKNPLLSKVKAEISNKVNKKEVKNANTNTLLKQKGMKYDNGIQLVSTYTEIPVKDDNNHSRYYDDGTIIATLKIPITEEERKNTHLEWVIGGNNRYSVAFKNLMQNEMYNLSYIEQNHPEYDIKEILNTDEKLQVFIYKTYTTIYDPENKDNTNVKVDRILKILDDIKNADLALYTYSYEIIKDDKNKEKARHIYTPKILALDNPIIKKTPKSFKTDLIDIVNNFKTHYGNDKIELVTSKEIKSDSKFSNIDNINHAKAFIYEGIIYVNVDKANTGDLAHEYMHLFLAYLRQKELPKYTELVNLVINLPDYDKRLLKFQNFKDTRSRADLNEEILVTKLGEFVTKNLRYSNIITEENFGTEFLNQIKTAFSKIFSLENTSLIDLSSSIGDLIDNFSSTYKENSNFKDDAIKSRTIVNAISKLIRDEQITEKCE